MAVVAAFVAAGAWFGAYGLMSGWLSLGDVVTPRLPFGSPVIGGVALALWVAVPFSVLVPRAWRGDSSTGASATLIGALLVLWLVVQLAFIRTVTPFHPTFAAVGLGFVIAGNRIRLRRPPAVDRAAVDRFLASHRIAVVGATDDPKKFGSTVVRTLLDRGYDVVPVNPNRDVVAGLPCVPDLISLRGPIDGVMVLLPASTAIRPVLQSIELGVPRVWLFRGAGQGAVSDDAVELCRRHGVDVVAGACPLMFLDSAGIHRAHLAVRSFTHAIG